MHGMGFAVKLELVKDLNLSPSYTNERTIIFRIPLIEDRYMTGISAYAPTLHASDDDKSSFYNTLSRVLKSAPTNDKPLLI